MSKKINIEGQGIGMKQINKEDYFSLTDMAKQYSERADLSIANWMQNNSTLRYIALWEKMNNPNFNPLVFQGFKELMQENGRFISIKRLRDEAGVIGIISTSGRYGGTFAHRKIAFEFASWLSPEFKYFLVSEFERLKSEEYKRNNLEWSTSRFLSKINYSLQTEAIETTLIPRLEGKEKHLAYASEADLINLVLFGKTAKQWREENPNTKGNIRDEASIKQLIVLSNLETHNSYLIMAGASKEARYIRLHEIALSQLEIFSRDKRLNDEKKFLE